MRWWVPRDGQLRHSIELTLRQSGRGGQAAGFRKPRRRSRCTKCPWSVTGEHKDVSSAEEILAVPASDLPVECTGIPLGFGGPFSVVARERRTAELNQFVAVLEAGSKDAVAADEHCRPARPTVAGSEPRRSLRRRNWSCGGVDSTGGT